MEGLPSMYGCHLEKKKNACAPWGSRCLIVTPWNKKHLSATACSCGHYPHAHSLYRKTSLAFEITAFKSNALLVVAQSVAAMTHNPNRVCFRFKQNFPSCKWGCTPDWTVCHYWASGACWHTRPGKIGCCNGWHKFKKDDAAMREKNESEKSQQKGADASGSSSTGVRLRSRSGRRQCGKRDRPNVELETSDEDTKRRRYESGRMS